MSTKAHDKDDEKDAKQKDAALTVEKVQKMIEAAFVRFEMAHGHLNADDGAARLKDLEG